MWYKILLEELTCKISPPSQGNANVYIEKNYGDLQDLFKHEPVKAEVLWGIIDKMYQKYEYANEGSVHIDDFKDALKTITEDIASQNLDNPLPYDVNHLDQIVADLKPGLFKAIIADIKNYPVKNTLLAGFLSALRSDSLAHLSQTDVRQQLIGGYPPLNHVNRFFSQESPADVKAKPQEKNHNKGLS